MLLLLILAPVLALMVAAAVIDLRSRRGRRIAGVDSRAARDERRTNEADLRTRSNDQHYGGF